jgi:hypothetical protein
MDVPTVAQLATRRIGPDLSSWVGFRHEGATRARHGLPRALAQTGRKLPGAAS